MEISNMSKGKQFKISPDLKINTYMAPDNSCYVVTDSGHKKVLDKHSDKDQFYIEDSKGNLWLFRFQGVNKSYSIVIKG